MSIGGQGMRPCAGIPRLSFCIVCWVCWPVFCLAALPAVAQDDMAEIRIGYIRQLADRPPNLSNLIVPPDDEGFAGARLSVKDNNTTGRFLKQSFVLEERDVPTSGDALPDFRAMLDSGISFFVLDVSADVLLAMADAAGDRPAVLLNINATDDRLRGEDCRRNVMHIVPSRGMYTDALAQFLVWKKWRDWLLVIGPDERDGLYAEAVRRSARKFGARIVEERVWNFGPDARRTAQAEVPAFTQGVDYDMLIVADEVGVFGEYLMYRTWDPRPVAGTQGLSPSTWHLTHEQWGSAQLQSRFVKTNGRRMTALDYQAWAAIRAVGEAATRTRSAEPGEMEAYLKSPQFELAGFKGLPLTFRSWNWQLRQPILLVQPSALVSVSPQDGFLHQRSVLDTMGLDEGEAGCAFQ
ncbi:MAG TPA: ABC transporter substrate-binding protein [Afifellaceae bacterium]|nr:ABC transporter substrate-binding protein [Afifellaceae bacterium]